MFSKSALPFCVNWDSLAYVLIKIQVNLVFPIFKRVLFFGNNQCIEIHRISSRKEDAMALWISMIIFCMTTEARLHVPHNVNKSKSISRTKFVKVLLWNEFLPYTHNFIVGLVRSPWILLCCQAGKANTVTQVSHPLSKIQCR